MPDKEGNIVPGEPGHYRYFKDKNATGAGKITGVDTLKNMQKKEAKSPEAPKDKAYSKDEAFILNRVEQEEILTKRKIDFDKKDKEKDMIKKILKSNPEE